MMIYGGHRYMLYLVSPLTVPQLRAPPPPFLSSAFIPLEKETGFCEFRIFFSLRPQTKTSIDFLPANLDTEERNTILKRHHYSADYCLLVHQVRSSTQNTYILSFPLCLSNSRFPLCSKPSKLLFIPPPLPLPRIPPLPPPRPLIGLSRSNLSIGLKRRFLVRFLFLRSS